MQPAEVHGDFISAYLSYIGHSEAPITFHRWSAITALGAWVGRDYIFPFGTGIIKPNIYCMLMGGAGTRKSTAIKTATKLIRGAGYKSIAADKSSKERLLMDLAGVAPIIADSKGPKSPEEILEENLFGDNKLNHIPEMLIAADEFNVFVGNGNIEFLSLLGVLWDYEGLFENRVKNSQSVEIQDPYLSILAGNTPTGFSLAFPPEAIGQGIFSRLILVHGESTGIKIPFPTTPAQAATQQLLDSLHRIKSRVKGVAHLTAEAKRALEAIYTSQQGIQDVRFETYMNRRFTHLIKLCLVISASYCTTTITEQHVILANTLLSHAEHSMHRALGEFGKAKHSDVSHKVMQVIEKSNGAPVTLKVLWQHVCNDLEDMNKLKEIISNLVLADKIQFTKIGYLPYRKVVEEASTSYTDYSLLTEQERRYIV